MRKQLAVFLLIIGMMFSLSAQGTGIYATRSLLKKKVYYLSNGKIGTCNYWSIPLGRFDCTVNQHFPGEGNLDIEASINFALISSGYIEGNGYGERGKVSVESKFVVDTEDSLKEIELSDIDYIYLGGRRVVLKDGQDKFLKIKCYKDTNIPKKMDIMIWIYNKQFQELKHSKDINNITAISFTKEGILKAIKAQKKAKAEAVKSE